MVRSGVAFAAGVALLLPMSAPSAAAPRTYVVVIDKMKFGAAPPGLRAGDAVIWDNRDIFRHTATAKDGSFNVDLPAGKKGKTVLGKAGTFVFACKYHPGMQGVLKVAK
jgi:plastocyanin